jgi:hypothetical protein
MTSLTNWCPLTDIDATLINATPGLSRNTLWPGYPRLPPPFHCTCVTDSYDKRKSCISLPLRTPMVSWITTKQLLLRQDAKSLHTRNQESGELGLPMGSMDTHWVPQCIIADVKMYTSRPRPVNASWILLNYFPTIIKCHSYRPPTDC